MPDSVDIAGYEVLEKLGAGAAGTVYKARQISMDRLVAIKILPKDVAQDKRFTERFTREARAVAKLNHPHVVTGIDVGESNGIWYFVMEYVDGESAAALVRSEGTVPEKDALEIARHVSLALEHAYKNGIVHRDIKPANILMTSTGVAKLADLGVAKQGEGEGKGGGGGRVFGTPYYMSPEQARGDRDIDIRSDIYSLGGTLYHLLTGRPPFHGHPPAVVMAKQIAEDPEDPRELNPRISRASAELVCFMMAKDRDGRPETPGDLEEEIKRVQRGRMPSKARTAPHSKSRSRRHGHSPAQASAGKGGMVAAAAVGALLLLGVGAWALMGGQRKPSDGPGNGRPSTSRTTPGTQGNSDSSPGGGDRKPDPERVARNALSAILARELRPGKELPELRKFIEEHPGTVASREAASRAAKLEARMEARAADAAMRKKVAALRDEVASLARRGQFDRAHSLLMEEMNKAEGALSSMVSKEIIDLHQNAELAIAKAGGEATRLCGDGQFRRAREAIKAINVKGMDDLVKEQENLLARVDGREKALVQAKEAKAVAAAEAAYAALCAKVNSVLAQFKPDDADRLLQTARRDRKLAPLSKYLDQDRRHVGYFREVVEAAAKWADSLKGNTRTFKKRDGSEQSGTIQGAGRSGVEIKQKMKNLGGATVRMTLPFTDLSDAEIVSLAMSALDGSSPETHLKTAVLYAAGGDTASARQELDAARKLGADTSAVERRWIGAAEEIRAGQLLVKARGLFAAFEAAKQRGNTTAMKRARTGLAETLTELKKYSHTEVYKANLQKSGSD